MLLLAKNMAPDDLKYYNVILQHLLYKVPYLSFSISYIILLADFR